MAVYERSTVVEAPLDTVWEFHSTIDGLLALTPGWMNMRVEDVTGPDGEPDPDVLEAGSEISLSMRPLGIGPRQSWTSRIVEREASGEEAHFRDTMRDGPFREWNHTHQFEAVEGGTRITDHVEYAFPRPFGRLSGLAWPGFEPMFAYRHRRTRAELE
ncbi:MAG: SRPBCC family protein [Halobacteriales archaeon]